MHQGGKAAPSLVPRLGCPGCHGTDPGGRTHARNGELPRKTPAVPGLRSMRRCDRASRVIGCDPGHVPTPWVLGLTSEPAIRRSHPVRPADSQSPLGVIGWVRKAPGSVKQQAPARPCVRWHSTTFIGSTACKAASSCPVRPCQRSGWHRPAPRIASPRRSPVPGAVTLGRVSGYMIRAGSSRCSRPIAWPSSWVTTARMTIGRVAAARACRNRSTLSHCVLNYA